MNKLKKYTILGSVFVMILGSFAHFFYDWTNENALVGLFTPINESTWEHMKLVYFPMLIFSIYIVQKYKDTYPCITSAFLSAILVGTWLIPVLFYTYTGIIGMSIMFFDVSTFFVAVIVSFYTAYRLTLSCKMDKFTNLLYILVGVMFVFFLLFTIFTPDIALFKDP